MLPIVREADGLAMSSRNAYLEPRRPRARRRPLARAGRGRARGARPARSPPAWRPARRELAAAGIEPEYLEARDADDLTPVTELGERPVLVAVAAQVGAARLIDNVVIDPRP